MFSIAQFIMESQASFKDYESVILGSAPDASQINGSSEQEKSDTKITKVHLKHIVEIPHPENPSRTKLLSIEDYHEASESTSADEFSEFAVLLRHQIDLEGLTLRYQLEIQSKSLRDYLKGCGRQFRNMNVDANPIKISHPFFPLFFLREKFAETAKDENGSALGREIQLLLDFIKSSDGLADVVRKYDDLVPHSKISFDMLWSLYAPNEVVYHHEGNIEQCFLVEHVELAIKEGRYIGMFHLVGGGHDGTRFGLFRTTLGVPVFSGVVGITIRNLPIIPMRLIDATERDAIQARLVKRGKDYIMLQTQKFKYLAYSGECWTPQIAERKMALRSEQMTIEVKYQ